MNSRARVQTILNGGKPDRAAVDIWHTAEVGQALFEHFGVDEPMALYKAMGLDKIVWIFPEYAPPPDASGHRERSGSTHFGGERTMWGAPLKTINTGSATYTEFAEAPLKDFDTPESLEDYPFWPDPEHFTYEESPAAAAGAARDFPVIGPWVSFYEVYCQLRGLEQAMMDLLMAPEYVDAVLDRVEAAQTQMMKRFFDRASASIDLTFISDDMGSQNGLLMSTDTWDRYFRDRMRRWCDLIHSYGIKVFFHSDGACYDLIPRLIDAGIDVLNPIQHVCPGMDMARLKDNFGDRLVFHGGVDNQHTLPFGSVEDVREETRQCLRTLGRDGRGFICCSCHNIQAGTPVENILAMVDTIKQEG